MTVRGGRRIMRVRFLYSETINHAKTEAIRSSISINLQMSILGT